MGAAIIGLFSFPLLLDLPFFRFHFLLLLLPIIVFIHKIDQQVRSMVLSDATVSIPVIWFSNPRFSPNSSLFVNKWESNVRQHKNANTASITFQKKKKERKYCQLKQDFFVLIGLLSFN